MIWKISIFALLSVGLLTGGAEADQKIKDPQGRITGTVRACGNGLCFRDAQGRPTGKIVQSGKRILVFNHRGQRVR